MFVYASNSYQVSIPVWVCGGSISNDGEVVLKFYQFQYPCGCEVVLYKAYLQKRSNGSFNTRVGVRWFLKDFAKKYDIRGFNTRVGVRWFLKNFIYG